MGRRHGSDPELLWPWCRLVATGLIRPLTWEPPYDEGSSLKRLKRQKNRKKKKKKENQYKIREVQYLSYKFGKCYMF